MAAHDLTGDAMYVTRCAHKAAYIALNLTELAFRRSTRAWNFAHHLSARQAGRHVCSGLGLAASVSNLRQHTIWALTVHMSTDSEARYMLPPADP